MICTSGLRKIIGSTSSILIRFVSRTWNSDERHRSSDAEKHFSLLLRSISTQISCWASKDTLTAMSEPRPALIRADRSDCSSSFVEPPEKFHFDLALSSSLARLNSSGQERPLEVSVE